MDWKRTLFRVVYSADSVRRISVGLFSAAGALLFAALNLVGAGISAEDHNFAALVGVSLTPLKYSALSTLISLVLAEAAAHIDPAEGHGGNLRTAFLGLAVAVFLLNGFCCLLVGGALLIDVAHVSPQ